MMSQLEQTNHPSFTNARINMHELGFRRVDLAYLLVPAFITASLLFSSDFLTSSKLESTLREECIANHIPNIQTPADYYYRIVDEGHDGTIKIPPRTIHVKESDILSCVSTRRRNEKLARPMAIAFATAVLGVIGSLGATAHASIRRRREEEPSAPSV